MAAKRGFAVTVFEKMDVPGGQAGLAGMIPRKEKMAEYVRWLEQRAVKLLHSKTGAAVARDLFGVDDEIYSAIWHHTTGRAHMTLLEKVIYLADYIEPTRDFPGVDHLRNVCYQDLDEGLLLGLEMTIQEMTAMGNPVHHATVEARDALRKE